MELLPAGEDRLLLREQRKKGDLHMSRREQSLMSLQPPYGGWRERLRLAGVGVLAGLFGLVAGVGARWSCGLIAWHSA